MTVSIVVPVFNAAGEIGGLLEALLAQTRPPDEIILVDDGSVDASRSIIQEYERRHPRIRYFYQTNQGPAAARNLGLRAATSEIILFTDDDCLPNPDWLEEMCKPFGDPSVGGVGGVYRTLRPENKMANFIGLEWDYKYARLADEVDCYSTYSLAVRHSLLRELGGFNEKYGHPCGEDWDLTYKLSARSRIVIQKSAVVGHYHPESLRRYLRTQFCRAKNRILLYQDHPSKKRGDSFTNPWIPLHLASSIALLLLVPLLPLLHRSAALSGLSVLLAACGSVDWGLMTFIAKRAPGLVPFSLAAQVSRNYAWIGGILSSYLAIFGAKIGLLRKSFMS